MSEQTSAPAPSPVIEVAHLSDTHIEFEQYPVTSPSSGRNQRGQDVLRAMAQVVDDITDWDPPLVIHSGDVADKAVISYRGQRQIQTAFDRMTVRPDGTRRMAVVISGNHDQPRDPREHCHLEPALRPLTSVAVVTNKYEVVDCADYVARGEAPAELANVVVHCVPHDTLKTIDWSEVHPLPGRINIFTSHGVVGGSELYRRCVGREYAIPIDVLTRGWDYAALGHWHKPGPVAVGGMSESTTPVYYAGSTENCGFSDLRDGVEGRGYNRVSVTLGEVPKVERRVLPIRAMFRLPAIDAAGLTYEELDAALHANVEANEIAGAVVDQRVTGVNRDTWAVVDVAAVKRKASHALWYQVTPVFTRANGADPEATEPSERLGDLGAVLAEKAMELLPEQDEREKVMALARKFLGSALREGPDGPAESEEGQPSADPQQPDPRHEPAGAA